MGPDKLVALPRDPGAFIRLPQVIFTTGDRIVALDHDKMFSWEESAVTLTSLGNNAAAVGEPGKHPVPLEVFLFGVVHVEQNARPAEQIISIFAREIAARDFRFRKAQRHEAEVAAMSREKLGVFGKKFFAPPGH